MLLTALARRGIRPAVSHRGRRGSRAGWRGVVTDTAGSPIPRADIEVWEADEEGRYDVQYGDGRTAGRARRE